ncbi:hypothetical protein [uncultured Prevotella sp.]|uniref:hypothetical protein n=1 Tax=uncultured Prevotella sp. TaxID=159272 RepID=UPI002599785D|nr:hypothetical protein [uncultured Prevotella sp.]
MKLKLFFVLLSLIFCGCSEGTFSPQNFYKVKKIVKKENNVFFIYAEKKDSIYKIYTHYNGFREPNSVELKRGSVFNLPLKSFNQRMIDEMGMASWADITSTIYYDVPVCKEEDKDIDDIYECESINGIYYGSDQIR